MAARIWTPILSTLLGVALSGAAQALVIDDFEGGAFSYSGTSTGDGGTDSVSFPAQVLGGTRQVYVESGSTTEVAIASLTLSPGDDDGVSLVLPASGGMLALSYGPPAPFDLTLGGSATEIEVTVPASSSGATLEVELTDTLAASDSLTAPIGPETTSYSFALADFTRVDATRIETVEVSVVSATAGSFEISHVAVLGTGSPLLWEVTQAQVSGPPYPSSPVEVNARFASPPDDNMPIGVTALSLVEAKMSSPPDDQLPFELVASGNGEVGSLGEQVGIEANWMPEPEDEYPDDASFQLEVELQPWGGLTPRLIHPPDPCSPSPEAFSVSFEVEYENSVGQLVGTARHHLHFQIGAGQDLEFTGVSATQGSVYIGFGTTKMGTVPSPFIPIFIMTVSAEFTQAPSLPALSGAALWLLAGSLLVSVVVWVRHRG
jgi:hypothetical protein